MKRNKRPSNVEVARRINQRFPKDQKYKWVPCIVCGDLCPQSGGDGFFEQFDNVHITCRHEPEYPQRVKELRKQREAEASNALF